MSSNLQTPEDDHLHIHRLWLEQGPYGAAKCTKKLEVGWILMKRRSSKKKKKKKNKKMSNAHEGARHKSQRASIYKSQGDLPLET